METERNETAQAGAVADVMTVDQVAGYLQIGRRTIYAMVKRGELPGAKVAGQWRFSRRQVDQWLERRAGAV